VAFNRWCAIQHFDRGTSTTVQHHSGASKHDFKISTILTLEGRSNWQSLSLSPSHGERVAWPSWAFVMGGVHG